MSDKEKASDSGIELSRKSRSGSGSFAGVDKSSYHDFDDSGHGSRRGTYDDDYDDDYIDPDDVKVDLDAFLGNVPPGDDVGDEEDEDEEEEGSEEGDGDEEEDDEGEYETEEEEAGTNVVGPSDEILLNVETPSHQLLEDQKEHHERTAKEKKRALIDEYLHEVKYFNHLRTKNILLGLKIVTHIDQTQTVIEKYVQRELDEQERLKEAERLKRTHLLEMCAAFKKGKKKKESGKKKRSSKSKKKKQMRTRFSVAAEPQVETSQTSSTDQEVNVLLKRKFDVGTEPQDIPNVSLNALGKEYVYKTNTLKEPTEVLPDISHKKACARSRQNYVSDRIGKRLKRFSFMRSQFFKDVQRPKTRKRKVDLMNLNLDKLHSKASKLLERRNSRRLSSSAMNTTPPTAAPSASSPSYPTRPQSRINHNLNSLVYGTRGRRRKFAITKEALGLARSKSRMALDHHKKEQTIRLHSSSTDYKDLHNFKFEFADPRLTAKQASVKLREDLIKLLSQRHIPTSQLRWPLEVKGVGFEGRNPYGRVSLNYTRLSHHERELPHTAYRILLTNVSFLRMKEQKMNKEHRKNMARLENECALLKAGLNQIFTEIVEGLRIFASVSGISDLERKEAKRANEAFIQDLQNFYDDFLTQLLNKLYESIHACEFALRRLWISEGKGEGAELHEFKDIMRCREKLKAEHKGIERSIMRYQRHSNRVLKTVRNSGKRLRDSKESISKVSGELNHLKKAVDVMIAGMHLCQETVKTQLATEVQLKSETGILSSPVLSADYERLLTKVEDTKIKRLDLQRQFNSKVRAIEKIMQPSSRFVRYKLRS